MGRHSAEYWDKQVHVVPKSQAVDRIAYLVKHATGKTILHIGCTGQLDVELCKVAKKCYGIDKQPLNRIDFEQINFDKSVQTMPVCEGVELVVCGEILEHLSNPGLFLDMIRVAYPVPTIFTVPNSHHAAGMEWLTKRGRENVNSDHVCYYSYTTLKTLLTRHGYDLVRHFWYGGKPYISEGLIAVALPKRD